MFDKNPKNGPIILLAFFSLAIIFSSIIISVNLFLEMMEMEAELKDGMTQFKVGRPYFILEQINQILTEQSWEMLFHWPNDDQRGMDDRPKRQSSSSYFASSWKGRGGSGNCR